MVAMISILMGYPYTCTESPHEILSQKPTDRGTCTRWN
jgi:hypothetical protein